MANASLPSYAECRYAYVDAETNCRSDRNCADCLTKKGCRIGSNGFCEPDTNGGSDDQRSFKRAMLNANVSLPSETTNTTQMWHFPALQTTYCRGDDVTCRRCGETNYGVADDIEDSRFCVGTGGCVCVLNCKKSFLEEAYCDVESPEPQKIDTGSKDGVVVITPVTVGPVPANQAAENKPHSVSVVVWVVLAVAIVLVCLLLRFLWRRLQARRRGRYNEFERELEDEPARPGVQAKPV